MTERSSAPRRRVVRSGGGPSRGPHQQRKEKPMFNIETHDMRPKSAQRFLGPINSLKLMSLPSNGHRRNWGADIISLSGTRAMAPRCITARLRRRWSISGAGGRSENTKPSF